MPKIPVILDTDIGTDIDDTWALAMLLSSPELDVRLVTTCTVNTTYRARIVARLLEVAGRTDIPVGVGLYQDAEEGGQSAWVQGYDLAGYPGRVYEDGVAALAETIMSAPAPVTLISIGPTTNIAAALEREPRIAERACFIGMHGALRKGYGGAAEPAREYNVFFDVPACQRTFAATWDMTITPLDTCGLVVLRGDKYRAVRASNRPLARAVTENYDLWAAANHHEGAAERSTVLFDTVAVYLAYPQHDLLAMEDLGVRVADDAMTVIDPAAHRVHCATSWRDLGAFEDLVVDRIARG